MEKQIKAVRSKAMHDLATQIRGYHISDTFDIAGVRWTLRTLEPMDNFEADSLIAEASQIQAARSHNRSRVAFAITHIDGIPVEQHFALPSDLTEEEKKLFEDPNVRRHWMRSAVFDFLMHEMQDEILVKLSESYVSLLKRKEAAMAALPGFSNGTTSAVSSRS